MSIIVKKSKNLTEIVSQKLEPTGGRTNTLLLQIKTDEAQNAYFNCQKGLTAIKLVGTGLTGPNSIINLSRNAAPYLGLASGIKTSSIVQNSLRIAGTVGSYVILACDSMEMMDRVATLHNIDKQLKKTATDSYQYVILKDMQTRMKILIASSACSVVMDTLEAAISTGAPILGLPVHIVGFALAIARIFGEQVVDNKTRKKLEKSVKAFAQSRQDLLQNAPRLKEKLAHAQAEFQVAQAGKEQTAKEQERTASGYRDPFKRIVTLEQQQAAQQADALAEERLRNAETVLNNLQRDVSDLQAYELANQLIEELDPLCAKRAYLERQRDSYIAFHETRHKGDFLRSSVSPRYERVRIKKFNNHLNQQLSELSRQYNELNKKREKIQLTLLDPKSRLSRDEELYLEKQAHYLSLEIKYLKKEIIKLEKECTTLKRYQKNSNALIEVNRKIEMRNKKKQEAEQTGLPLENQKTPSPISNSTYLSPTFHCLSPSFSSPFSEPSPASPNSNLINFYNV